jgi:hypothetical protein
MQTIDEVFLSARGNAELRREKYDTGAHEFGRGVEWVRNFLVPTVEQGNSELRQHHIAIRLDLNPDSPSTNSSTWLVDWNRVTIMVHAMPPRDPNNGDDGDDDDDDEDEDEDDENQPDEPAVVREPDEE